MIRWITPRLGTASWNEVQDCPDISIVDVRDLVDGDGNTPAAVHAKVLEGFDRLQQGNSVVIACDYGISRSNAVAAGILSLVDKTSLDDAVKKVMASTGEAALQLGVLGAVRASLAREVPARNRRSSTTSRRVLLTGASGFVGSALVPLLLDQAEVTAPPHEEIDLARDAVLLDLLVKQRTVDTLVHLATPRVYTTAESLGTSLVMLKNVLDVCAVNDVRLIFLSGWEVFSGYRTSALIADNNLAPLAGSTYGQAKFLAEMLVQNYCQRQGLRATVLRSGPVYGVGSDRPKFIWNFLRKALADQDIVTHQYLNGFPTLDLMHVDDLARAIAASIGLECEGVLNLGTGKATSTAEIAEWIVGRVGSRSKISHRQINRYTANIIMDNHRASELLQWKPKVELLDGLAELVRHVTSAEKASRDRPVLHQ